jgi:predicted metal-binding membrane protein
MDSMPVPESWSAPSVLGMWIAMMAAMMLPSLAPGVWRYREAAANSGATRPALLAALVGVAYFVVWTLFGMAVLPLGTAVEAMKMQLPELARAAPVVSGAVVLMAGAFQLTTWKAHHLACCRAMPECRTFPPSARTAARDGLRIGLHCCQSCFGFVAMLLAFGIMDVRAMAVVTAAITAERLAPSGERVARATGALAVAGGLMLIARAGGLA